MTEMVAGVRRARRLLHRAGILRGFGLLSPPALAGKSFGRRLGIVTAPSTDTIAAIATPPGDAGLAVVRVSGPAALAIADRVFRCRQPPPSRRASHTVVHGWVHGPAGDMDEALLVILLAPHTYTGEDTVEIQCHGGAILSRSILQLLLDHGARMADPGEFTLRAFLNGRMDLAQAEGVSDLIHARSERAARAAMEQVEGRFSLVVNRLYDEVIELAADMEASLDFSDEEVQPVTKPKIIQSIHAAIASANEMLATWREGHLLRDGALVVIAGRPNVGKSTLMNSLLGRDRSIVSHLPGTTRDVVEEGLIVDGIPVRLADTAGLRETECAVEGEGVRRALDSVERADLVLYVTEAAGTISSEDSEQLNRLDPGRTILILNKTDLCISDSVNGSLLAESDMGGLPTVRTSLIRGEGLQEVREALAKAMTRLAPSSETMHGAISDRHRQLLQVAVSQLPAAGSELKSNEEDRTATAVAHVRVAAESLGTITGRVYSAELLASIFSRFCVGK